MINLYDSGVVSGTPQNDAPWFWLSIGARAFWIMKISAVKSGYTGRERKAIFSYHPEQGRLREDFGYFPRKSNREVLGAFDLEEIEFNRGFAAKDRNQNFNFAPGFVYFANRTIVFFERTINNMHQIA